MESVWSTIASLRNALTNNRNTDVVENSGGVVGALRRAVVQHVD
jgi:hypothetical protein